MTYVRADDNEYDIQFEDGTVYTLPAKDVRKTVPTAKPKSERKRSRSRGRSPSRKTATEKSPDGKFLSAASFLAALLLIVPMKSVKGGRNQSKSSKQKLSAVF